MCNKSTRTVSLALILLNPLPILDRGCAPVPPNAESKKEGIPPARPAIITPLSHCIGKRRICTEPPNPSERLTASAAATNSNSVTPSPPTSVTASNIFIWISAPASSISISHADLTSLCP